MPTLHIRLLGDFQITRGKEPVNGIATPRPQSVLAYLLLHRHAPQARRHVAFTLWPTLSESRAHANLRKQLYLLRRDLPDVDQFLHIDNNIVHWRPDAPFTLDVAEFERAVDLAVECKEIGDTDAIQAALEEAVRQYRGDLLPNCYDDWILAPREMLSRMHLRTLDQLDELLESKGEYASAIRYVQRMLRHDPHREATYRRLMELYALNGNRAQALRAYQRCATMLDREFEVKPSPATREVYDRVVAQQPATLLAASPLTAGTESVPLVGRQREWTELLTAWRTTVHSGPHLALIAGESGIGKTRLAEELLAWAGRRGIAMATARSFAAEGPLAYAPVIGLLRSDVLQRAMSQLSDVWLVELARLLPELLTRRPDLPRPEPLTESWHRQRLFEAIARLVLKARQPLVLFIDDLQWSDEQTLAWLHYLLRFDPQAQLLVVGTVRLEEVGHDHPLQAWLTVLQRGEQLAKIVLDPLDEDGTATLAGHVAGCDVSAAARAVLYRETEGNPLFIVEMSRTDSPAFLNVCGSVEQDVRGGAASTLPSRVQAVLEQRLEQLSPTAREVAAVAAVIGRGFDFDVIVQASHRDRGEVVSALDELCVRGIVHERENGTYDFGHEKIREVAYNALSLARRRLLHRRAARALESLFAHDAEASGNLARHYAAAGATEKAVDYQLAAGQRALELSAHREAIWHLEQGLDLLESGPRTADRDRIELAFRMALASAMIPQSGFAAPEVREIYDRAAKLAQQLGEKPQLVPVLYGLGQYYMLRGKWKKSQALGERALDLAEHARQPDGLLLAHALLGFVLSYMGEPAEASNHLEASLARYDQQAESPIPGTDLGVMCRCYSALMLLVRGYPRLSKAEMDDALRLAHDLSRPHSLAAALNHASGLHLLRREAAATQRYAEKCIALSTEYGFTHWNALSGILQGWALSQQGSPSEGLAQAQRGLARLAALGVDLNPYTFTLLAEIHGNAADVVQGLHAVNRAIAAQDDGLRAFASMTLRIRGDLLRLRDADLEGAETSYRQAIDVARAQGVRTFELQATLGLCRLLRKQERQAEAQKLLAKMHDWFTEGFDTPDLKAARALLAAWT